MISNDTEPMQANTISPSSSLAPHDASNGKHVSRVSVDSTASIHSTRSHQEYLDSLVTPSTEEINRIASVQEEREEELIKKRLSKEDNDLDEEELSKAAGLIQRNYRGYRDRRQLKGLALDPTSRWVEALKEARYRNLTTPKAREVLKDIQTPTDSEGDVAALDGPGSRRGSSATRNWKKIGFIVKRAAGDEDAESDSSDDGDVPDEQLKEIKERRAQEKTERQKAAKIMDLQYWLEMTDLKHRYGSNLRTYHEEWKKSHTNENFFYWLDYGEGRGVECAGCPRERLDRERVRYLSREERLNYLVKIDNEGRLCWAKNGARIDTTVQYRDSVHGIVPQDDPAEPYTAPAEEAMAPSTSESSDQSSTSSTEGNDHHQHESSETARAAKYATPGFDQAKGVKKVKHVSASTIFNKLLRSSVRKNTWIFVADTNFRLYVGIKQSGAFQHSSFLHGSRIAAAGLIKINDGRLSKLSPLSGHYRPPVASFRRFIHSLQDAGVDMSHVSISRSYAVLVGLEAYVKTRRKGKRIVQALIHGRDKLLSPEELRQREEEERDKSESAERERRVLELEDEAQREENLANLKLIKKLNIIPTTPKNETEAAAEEVEKQEPEKGEEKKIEKVEEKQGEKIEQTETESTKASLGAPIGEVEGRQQHK